VSLSLREKQSLFARLYGTLIGRIYTQGYEATLDWLYRPPEIAAYYADLGIGIRSSLHTLKLAGDINLFKNGIWQRTTEAHRPFGVWWEKQDPLCVWGGRWGDGNHYAVTHNGIK
jgi:hypothetical protein